MIISIIAAIAKNRVIGNQEKLPWHIPEDLKWFKQTTMGKPIIMGNKTYKSIGKPLPGRKNIILSKSDDLIIEGCFCFSDIQKVFTDFSDEEEIVVIGGAQIYKIFLPLANKMYLTLIDHEFPGDILFPEYDRQQWSCIEEIPLANNQKYPFKCKHVVYEKTS